SIFVRIGQTSPHAATLMSMNIRFDQMRCHSIFLIQVLLSCASTESADVLADSPRFGFFLLLRGIRKPTNVSFLPIRYVSFSIGSVTSVRSVATDGSTPEIFCSRWNWLYAAKNHSLSRRIGPPASRWPSQNDRFGLPVNPRARVGPSTLSAIHGELVGSDVKCSSPENRL